MRQRTAVPAKIVRPIPGENLARERLFERLDEALRRPVAWVSAPAGFGKTTLVSSYVESRGLPCLWYQVDPGDDDLASFFYYLGLAGRKAAPRRKNLLPLLAPEYAMGVAAFSRNFFEELFERLGPRALVVLDSCHEVDPSAPLHAVLLEGVNRLSGGVRFLFLSRGEPPPAYARLRSHGEMAVVGRDLLRLTPEELEELARLRGVAAHPDELRRLHGRARGWAAGLQILLEAARADQGCLRALGETTVPEELFEYFGGVVFERLDPELRDFLLKTSFLPDMTVSMAEALTGHPRAAQILSALYRSGDFTERRAGTPPVFRYHPLFREFLLSHAVDVLPPDEVARIQRSAAALLIESGQLEEAADLLTRSRDWEGLVPLVLKYAPSLLAAGRSGTLNQWLVGIPEEVRDHAPWLLYWLGVCRLGTNPAESRAYLQKAFQSFGSNGDEIGVFLAWSGVVQTFLFEFDDFRPLDTWIRWLDERGGLEINHSSPYAAAAVASGMAGALTWRMPFHPDARRWMKAAIAVPQENLNIDARLRACTNIAIFYIWMGNFIESGILIEQMRRMVRSQAATPAREIALRIAEAMFCNASAPLSGRAGQAVSEGLEIARESGVRVMDTLLYLQGAQLSLNEGDKDKAREFLSRMEKTMGSDRRAHAGHYFFHLSWYFVLVKDISRALMYAKESLRWIEEAGLPVSESLARLALALITYQSGAREEAHTQLEAARSVGARTGSSYCKYLCDMAGSYLSFENGDSEEGLKFLRRALSSGRERGYVTMVHFWRPDILSYLCGRALEAGIEVEHVQSLIRHLRLTPSGDFMHIQDWPWTLKVRTFGRFEVLRDGSPLRFSRKAQQKPIEMLKVLIALGGKAVREVEISDFLWPDADGDAAHFSATATLHRLRKLAGREDVLRVHEGRVTVDERVCWVDVWAFERLVDRAHGKWAEGAADEAARLTEAALELYRGAFLGEEGEEPWAVSARERLRSKFLRGVRTLGDHWARAGEWERAAECFEKGLEVDDLAESFCQGLMSCYQHLERRGEALSLYRRFAKRLKAVLGVEPAAKTKALHDALAPTTGRGSA